MEVPESNETIALWYILLILVFVISISIIILALYNVDSLNYKNVLATIKEENCFPPKNNNNVEKDKNGKNNKNNENRKCYYKLSYTVDNVEMITTYPMLDDQLVIVRENGTKNLEISYDIRDYSKIKPRVDLFFINIISVFVLILLIMGAIALYKYRKEKMNKLFTLFVVSKNKNIANAHAKKNTNKKNGNNTKNGKNDNKGKNKNISNENIKKTNSIIKKSIDKISNQMEKKKTKNTNNNYGYSTKDKNNDYSNKL
jgi:hypothetical protein